MGVKSCFCPAIGSCRLRLNLGLESGVFGVIDPTGMSDFLVDGHPDRLLELGSELVTLLKSITVGSLERWGYKGSDTTVPIMLLVILIRRLLATRFTNSLDLSKEIF